MTFTATLAASTTEELTLKSNDIAAYMFRADIYCRDHILDALPTGVDQAFGSWKDLSRQPVEHSLSELAYAFGFDRENEHTFDSDEFPKVVSEDQLDGAPQEHCLHCFIEGASEA